MWRGSEVVAVDLFPVVKHGVERAGGGIQRDRRSFPAQVDLPHGAAVPIEYVDGLARPLSVRVQGVDVAVVALDGEVIRPGDVRGEGGFAFQSEYFYAAGG